MEEEIIIFLMLVCGFGGFIFFVWSIILLFCINSNQKKTFKMLSALMQQIAEVKKTFSTPQKDKVDTAAQRIKEKASEIEKKDKKETFETAAEPVSQTPSKSEIVREMSKPQEKKPKLTPQASQGPRPKPPEPRKPTAFEEKAGYILKKIWNWIVVGEEFRNPKLSMEYAVASAWLMRVGILIIILGVGFTINLTKDWIKPIGKVSGILAGGIVMLAFGLKLLNKKYHAIAQGLIGGGIALLYAGIFAGFKRYEIIDAVPAFALMIIITLGAGFISVRWNSLLVAIFGVVGGYCTPLLIRTGSGNLPGLFTYLILLGVCTLVIARYRDWKLLNFLSFIFTYGLFFVSMGEYYKESEFFMAITFLSLFFILFSFIPILYNLINKHKSTVIELMFMFINSSVFAITSYFLIRNKFGSDQKEYYAIITISLAAFYIIQILFFMKKKIEDRNFLTILSGLASVFITLTIPSLLSDEWFTTAWAIQAVVFMWMSSRIKSNFIRFIAHMLYLITFGSLLIDMGEFRFPETAYFPDMLNRFVTMGITILSLAGSYFILKREKNEKGEIPEYAENFRKNDFGKSFGTGSIISGVFFWVAFVFVFVYLHIELFSFCRVYYPPMRFTILSFIWLGALFYIFSGTQKKKGITLFPILVIGTIIFLIKLLVVDMIIFWEFTTDGWVYAGPYSIEDGFMRLLDFIPAVAFFAYTAFIAPKRIGEKEEGNLMSYQMFAVLSLALLFLYTTLELSSFLIEKAPGFRAGGVSILWSIYAIAFVLFGILKDSKALRYAGLALFVVIVGKVFFSDMARLSQLYKIIAFVVLGLIILGGSFVYIKFKDFFETEDEDAGKEKK